MLQPWCNLALKKTLLRQIKFELNMLSILSHNCRSAMWLDLLQACLLCKVFRFGKFLGSYRGRYRCMYSGCSLSSCANQCDTIFINPLLQWSPKIQTLLCTTRAKQGMKICVLTQIPDSVRENYWPLNMVSKGLANAYDNITILTFRWLFKVRKKFTLGKYL